METIMVWLNCIENIGACYISFYMFYMLRMFYIKEFLSEKPVTVLQNILFGFIHVNGSTYISKKFDVFPF
jgi:hypothetical protein